MFVRRPGPEPLARAHDLEREVAGGRRRSRAAICSSDGPSATTTTEVPAGAWRPSPSSARCTSSGWSMAMSTTVASPVGRLVEPRRHVGRGPVADGAVLLDVERHGRGQGEVGAPVDDLPAGRLDDLAQPVGLVPVLGGAGRRPFMGGGQDLLGDALSTHRPRIRGRSGSRRSSRWRRPRDHPLHLPGLLQPGQDRDPRTAGRGGAGRRPSPGPGRGRASGPPPQPAR